MHGTYEPFKVLATDEFFFYKEIDKGFWIPPVKVHGVLVSHCCVIANWGIWVAYDTNMYFSQTSRSGRITNLSLQHWGHSDCHCGLPGLGDPVSAAAGSLPRINKLATACSFPGQWQKARGQAYSQKSTFDAFCHNISLVKADLMASSKVLGCRCILCPWVWWDQRAGVAEYVQ